MAGLHLKKQYQNKRGSGLINRCLSRNNGFTLAELLIVVAITGILTAFGFVNVVEHQRQLKLTEMDNIAREIFTAAQNHLTESASTGEWDRIYKSRSQDSSSFLGQSLGDNNKRFDLQGASVSVKDTEITPDYYVLAYPQHSLQDSALSILLPNGAAEPTARENGSYIIEYDAANAMVYGVFYTDPQGSGVFVSKEGTITLDDEKKIDRVERQNRLNYGSNKLTVGYYGGGVQVDHKPEEQREEDKVTEAVAPQIRIINAERLLLEVIPQTALGFTETETITIKVTTDSGAEKTYTISRTASSLTSTYDGTADGKYYYILDSIADEGKSFKTLFPKAVPGENLKATAVAQVSKSVGSTNLISNEAVATTDSANSLYADGSTANNATIENARHLQNLSQSVSDCTTVQTALIANDISWHDFETAIANNEYGISGKVGTFKGIVSGSLVKLEGNNQNSKRPELSDFVIEGNGNGKPAGLIATIADTTEAAGQHNLEIKNLIIKNSTVKADGNSAGMLVGSFNHSENAVLSISKVDVVTGNATAVNAKGAAGGLVGYVGKGSLSVESCHITANGSEIKSNNNGAGAVLGQTAGSVKNVSIRGITIGGSGITINGVYAGGVVGSVPEGVEKLDISSASMSSDRMSISGTTNAGGIVGTAVIKAGAIGSIVNSTVNAPKIQITSNGGNAGGAIGSITNQSGTEVKLSVVSAGVPNTGTVAVNGHTTAGGLVGNVSGKLALAGSSVRGKTITATATAGNAGGLIAQAHNAEVSISGASASVEPTNDSFRDTTYKLTVNASGNAGGLIGSTSGSKLDAKNAAIVGGKEGKVTGGSNAGGFIGVDASSTSTINKSYTSILVQSTAGNAGGFIGDLSGSFTIDQCYAAGRTDNGVYASGMTNEGVAVTGTTKDSNVYTAAEGASAGGFVGKVNAGNNSSIVNSYTTTSVGAEGGSAGGFIGAEEGTGYTIGGCYTTAFVSGGENTARELFVGSGNVSTKGGEQDNYILSGIKGNVTTNSRTNLATETSIGTDDTPFAIPAEENKLAPAKTYDTSLKGKFGNKAEPSEVAGKYAYKTTNQLVAKGNGMHIGDWPVAENTEEDTPEFGVLYFERVQHGYNTVSNGTYVANSATSNLYYHGWLWDKETNMPVEMSSRLDAESAASNARIDISKESVAAAGGLNNINDHGLVNQSGEYVTEDGYVIAVKKTWLADDTNLSKIQMVFAGNNTPTLKDLIDCNAIMKYPDLERDLGMEDYYLFFINPYNKEKIDLRNEIINNNRENKTLVRFTSDTPKLNAAFSWNPFMSDAIANETIVYGNTYYLRSAYKLNELFNSQAFLGPGYSYGQTSILQQLDICFDTNKVTLKDPIIGNEAPVSSPSAKVFQGYYDVQRKPGTENEHYELQDLTSPFIEKLDDGSGFSIRNVTIVRMNAPYFIGDLGSQTIVQNISITDGAFTNADYGLFKSANAAVNSVDTIKVNHATFAGYGLLSKTNVGNAFTNIHFYDVRIEKDGFFGTMEGGCGGINNSDITNAIIKGNGIAGTATGKIDNCKIINAQIGENGFCNEAGWNTKITNCQIYGDESQYTRSEYYEANAAITDPSIRVSTGKGYNLITIGVKPGTSTSTGKETVAGFIGNNSAEIENCSVTGQIIGNNVAGFVSSTVQDIKHCYANVLIKADGNAAGFVYDHQRGVIEQSHALGIISAKNAAGFAYNEQPYNGKEHNCYTAIWSVNLSNKKGSYEPFTKYVINGQGEDDFQNCYMLTFKRGDEEETKKFWEKYASVEDTLEVRNNKKNYPYSALQISSKLLKKDEYAAVLGMKTNSTRRYGQFPTAGGNYPYPMGTVMTHYGDWWDSENADLVGEYGLAKFYDEKESATIPFYSALVERGFSAESIIPRMEFAKGQVLAGWYHSPTLKNETTVFQSSDWIMQDAIDAYAGVKDADGYVTLYAVNPSDNKAVPIGVYELDTEEKEGGEKPTSTEIEFDSPRVIGGYTPQKDGNGNYLWTTEQNPDAEGNYKQTITSTTTVEGAEVVNKMTVPNTVHRLYLHYTDVKNWTITIEYRIYSEQHTRVISSDKHELPVGTTATQSFALSSEIASKGTPVNKVFDSNYREVNSSVASLRSSDGNRYIDIKSFNGDATYVILINAPLVQYKIKHIFKNTDAGRRRPQERSINGAINEAGNRSIVENLQYYSDENSTYTIVETATAPAGTVVTLSEHGYMNDSPDDSGYVMTFSDVDMPLIANTAVKEYEITYTRREFVVSFNTDGGKPLLPVVVMYGQPILKAITDRTTTLQKDAKYGFRFKNWNYDINGGEDYTTPVNDSTKMPGRNITLKAQWTPLNNTKITIEVMTQKVTDPVNAGETGQTAKDYDYYASFVVNGIRPGEAPYNLYNSLSNENWLNINLRNQNIKQDFAGDMKFFYFNSTKTGAAENINQRVNSDGSTVYRVYYDRKKIVLNFLESQKLYIHPESYRGYTSYYLDTNPNGSIDVTPTPKTDWYGDAYLAVNNSEVRNFNASTDWVTADNEVRRVLPNNLVYRAEGLYGQSLGDVSNYFNDNTWKVWGGRENTLLTNYILDENGIDDGTKVEYYLVRSVATNENMSEVYHYYKGSDNQWHKWMATAHLSTNRNLSLSNKFFGFYVVGYANDLTDYPDVLPADTDFQKGGSGTTASPVNGKLAVFHERNPFNVYLEQVDTNSNLNTVITVPYEQNLNSIGLLQGLDAPTYMLKTLDRNGTGEGWTFDGWYTSASGGTKIDANSTVIMPNNDIHLYAHWVSQAYTVNYVYEGQPAVAKTVYRYQTLDETADQAKNEFAGVENMKFIGWYLKDNPTDPWDELKRVYPSMEMSDDVPGVDKTNHTLTLYARYEVGPGGSIQYTVKHYYDATREKEAELIKVDETYTAIVNNQFAINTLDTTDQGDELIAKYSIIKKSDDDKGTRGSVQINGIVEGKMNGYVYEIYYARPGDRWEYNVKGVVQYKDMNESDPTKVLTAELALSDDEKSGSSSYSSAVIYAPSNGLSAYLQTGDSYKIVNKTDNNLMFTYEPDLSLINLQNAYALYNGEDQKDKVKIAYEGMDSGWVMPEGYSISAAVTEIKYGKGETAQSVTQAVNAGEYTIKANIVLSNGTNAIILCQKEAKLYIQKRTVVMVSADGSWDYKKDVVYTNQDITTDKGKNPMPGIEGDGWIGDDSKQVTYAFTSNISIPGTVANEFTYSFADESKLANYNIYRKFGNLTVNGVVKAEADSTDPVSTNENEESKVTP